MDTVLGLQLDKNIEEYIAARNYLCVNPHLSGLPYIWRTEKTELLQSFKDVMVEGRIVLGGSGLMHHVSYALSDMCCRGLFDKVTIDNHSDTRFLFEDEKLVGLDNHITFSLVNRNVLHIQNETGTEQYTFYKRGLTKKDEIWIPEDTPVHSLYEGLDMVSDTVYLTVDIDVLGTSEYTLADSMIPNPRVAFKQGVMEMDRLLSLIDIICDRKKVIAVDIFGMCDDRKTFDIYDRIIEKIGSLP